MNRLLPLAFIGILLAMLASACIFVVDQRKYAIVFSLGKIERVIDKPGLHFKLPPPFQNIVTLDKRILTIDTPDADRFITSEKKNVLVDSFVKWQIVDPQKYWVSVSGNETLAADRLTRTVRAALNEEISKRTVRAAISGERDKIMQDIKVKVNDDAKEIGVRVVDVRLKRVDFVPEISDSVFRRMESERLREANDLRAKGTADGEKIRADADRQREVKLAQAYGEAQKTRGEGDAEASALYAKAFNQNAEFYSFYRSLEAYRNSFKNKSDVLVVEPSSEFFKYLKSSGAPAK